MSSSDDDAPTGQWLMILLYLSETGSQGGNRYEPKIVELIPVNMPLLSAN